MVVEKGGGREERGRGREEGPELQGERWSEGGAGREEVRRAREAGKIANGGEGGGGRAAAVSSGREEGLRHPVRLVGDEGDIPTDVAAEAGGEEPSRLGVPPRPERDEQGPPWHISCRCPRRPAALRRQRCVKIMRPSKCPPSKFVFLLTKRFNWSY